MSNRNPKGHLTGSKITSSHTTLIEAAMPVVRAAESHRGVTKIGLGLIKVIGNGVNAIKISVEGPGCLLAKVRGRSAIQEIRIYVSPGTDLDELSDTLTQALTS